MDSDDDALNELSDSWVDPGYEQPFRGEAEAVYTGRVLQYLLAFALILAAVVIFKALDEWTPGPRDDRTFWEKMEGKKR